MYFFNQHNADCFEYELNPDWKTIKNIRNDGMTNVSQIIGELLYFLLPLFFPLVLCVLQHFLLPEVKEVGRISVELERFLVIVPAVQITRGERSLYDILSPVGRCS